MQAFTKCRIYTDYLSVINDSILNDNLKIYEDNANGLSSLAMVSDPKDQDKIIRVFKIFDNVLSYHSSKNNEMFKKINYLLSTGVLFHDYKEFIENLNATEIFTLVFGEYSKVNEYNKEFLPIFSNKQLLSTIITKNDEEEKSKNYTVFGVSDYFFMIKEHFKKNPFDINDLEKRNSFIQEMIERINNNTLHNGVNNMIEYWESDEIKNIRRGVL